MPAAIPDLVAALKEAFPRQNVSVGTVRVYAAELSDLPPAAVETAVRSLIRTSEFFPTIAAIRSAAAESMLALPTEDQAVAEVHARIRWAQTDPDERPDMPELHPLTRAALDAVGGFAAWRNAERPEVLRGQFGRLYREGRERALRETTLGALAPSHRPKELTR